MKYEGAAAAGSYSHARLKVARGSVGASRSTVASISAGPRDRIWAHRGTQNLAEP